MESESTQASPMKQGKHLKSKPSKNLAKQSLKVKVDANSADAAHDKVVNFSRPAEISEPSVMWKKRPSSNL